MILIGVKARPDAEDSQQRSTARAARKNPCAQHKVALLGAADANPDWQAAAPCKVNPGHFRESSCLRRLLHDCSRTGFFIKGVLDSTSLTLARLAWGSGGLHLLVDLASLLDVKLGPKGHCVKLQVPDEIGRAAVLDLVQEECPLIGVPIGLLVVDLAVRATDVSPDQCHGNWLPVRRLEFRQALERLPPDPLGILKELLGDVIARHNLLHAVIGRHCSLVRDRVQELAVEPEATSLPIADEALNRLLDDVLWAIRELLKVVLQDLGVALAL
eukprot:CAMPEP_0115607846 /NCGR_PEP_ID=MMETSP0272-20121206/18710_1 /TAXON_ID=71861 /ORGANISM="Scrippsiella trochoidea, Strain CCMP3099" /LENGTH=271 /DNA_ID=CAMNT_0003043525 /DNA_START=162 /DNA_END=974 /DNA_ORIENTATION=+